MKITKNIGYAINWLAHSGKNASHIAEELDLTEKQVSNYLEKHYHVNDTKIPIKSEPVKKRSSKDLMIRHTSNKKNNTVAIMTKEASELNDSLRPSLNSSRNNQECIFKPNSK